MEERQAPAWHERWTPVTQEPAHPLAALEGQPLAGAELRVLLGPSSRFGARYFALLLADAEGRATREPVLSGLHHQGPLPSYNWIEVAETKQRVQLPDATAIDIGDDGIEQLFELLYALIPPGGHLMVEYDSPQRAETAQALAHGVPPIATPLGELLFRVGFAAHFKDWQIAEGGSEGPRKLQAYKPPSPDDTRRWAQQAADQLRAFLAGPPPSSPIVRAGQERAQALLPSLAADD